MLLGVAGGLGERLGVDPVLIRVAFAVLAIAGGSGVVLYLLAWAVSVEPDDETARARPVRRPSARQAFALGLVVLGTMLLLREVGLWFGDQIVWPIALAAAGSAVIWARSDDRDRARWARIPGNPIEAMFTGRVGLIRIVVGGLLVASGLGLGFANTGADLAAAGDALLGVAITLIGLGLIFGPWATRLVSQLAEERRGRIRSEARAEMAAHLHDSVLHTLALIQRADASPEVVNLARRQERELRAWLYRAPVPRGPAAAGRRGDRDPGRAAPQRARRRRGGRRRPARRGRQGAGGRLPGGGLQRGPALGGAAGLGLRRGGAGRAHRVRARRGQGVRPRRGADRPARHRRLDPRPHPAPRRHRLHPLRPRRGHRGPASPAEEPVIDDHASSWWTTTTSSSRGSGPSWAPSSRSWARPARWTRPSTASGAPGPDVVLLDVHLPGGGGRAVLEAVRQTDQEIRFLALSVSDAAEDVIGVIRAGARGYVTKTISPPDLAAAIRRVQGGDAVFSPAWPGSCSTPSTAT